MISFPLQDLIDKGNEEAIVVALAYIYSALEQMSDQINDLNKELMRKI
jgi:hypothetical protein